MLLYTVVPEEFIFAVDEVEEQARSNQAIEFKIGQINLIGQPLSNGRVRIIRQFSSNSQDYLDPKWQPGTVL
jgi:hypothetical protein